MNLNYQRGYNKRVIENTKSNLSVQQTTNLHGMRFAPMPSVFWVGICFVAATVFVVYWDTSAWAKTTEATGNGQSMTWAKAICSLGLFLDIVGVIIIAFFVRYETFCDGHTGVKPRDRVKRLW